MDIGTVIEWGTANPEASLAISAALVQGISWGVKKTPWLWDDTALGWCIKNKGGLSIVFNALRRKKK